MGGQSALPLKKDMLQMLGNEARYETHKGEARVR